MSHPLRALVWLFGVALAFATGCGTSAETIGATSPTDKLDTHIHKGKTYRIDKGILYVDRNQQWKKVEDLRNPRFQHFVVDTVDGKAVFLDTKKKVTYPAQKNFQDSFENANEFLDLFSPTSWSSFVLQSPRTPNKKKYAKLRKAILAGKSDFYDNRIDIVSDNTHSGKRAIRFHSVKPSGRRPTKTYIEKDNLYFVRGDELWMSAWFFLESGVPSTIVDFGTRWLKGSPGPRFFIRADKFVIYELKFLDKPVLVQRSTALPMRKWFELKIRMKLSSQEDGAIDVWQDGKKILGGNGRTLPTSDSVLHIFEIGVTATDQDTVMYLDDVVISDRKI